MAHAHVSGTTGFIVGINMAEVTYLPTVVALLLVLVLHLHQRLQTCLNLKDLSSEGWSFTIWKVVCFLTKKSNSNNRAYAWNKFQCYETNDSILLVHTL